MNPGPAGATPACEVPETGKVLMTSGCHGVTAEVPPRLQLNGFSENPAAFTAS